MKTKKRFSLIVICILCIWRLAPSVAAPNLQTVYNRLQQNAATLATYDYTWSVTESKDHQPVNVRNPDAERRAIETGIRQMYKGSKIVDSAHADEIARKTADAVVHAHQEHTSAYKGNFSLDCTPDSILMKGQVESNAAEIYKYQEYYSGDSVLYDTVGANLANGTPLYKGNDIVWRTSGRSIFDPPAVVNETQLFPEQIAWLAGADIAQIYHASWRISKTDADGNSVDLGSTVKINGFPATLSLTLDARHGYAPLAFSITEQNYSVHMQATGFRQVQGCWIASEFRYAKNVNGQYSEVQQWKLVGAPILGANGKTLVTKNSVDDYRLLSDALGPLQFIRFQHEANPLIVHYRWPGRFPTLDDLKNMHNAQHPGEASPDPGKSTSLPIVGGVMALVGAVWMFKRRGGAV